MPLVRIAILAGKADIDMPAGITGIVWVREAHRETAEVLARTPASFADQLVESRQKRRRVHCFPERLLPVIAKPDHRSRRRIPVIGVASKVAPHDGAAFLGKFAGKSSA